MGINCSCAEQSISECSIRLNLSKPIINDESPNKPEIDIISLTKLQSLLRGYLDRRRSIFTSRQIRYKISKKPPNPDLGLPSSISFSKIPDYSSPTVKNLQEKLGIYKFENIKDSSIRNSKAPVLLSNQAIYIGQWNEEDQRDGFGMQIWPNSTMFEGLWKKDKIFKGRLIFDHGEVYEGEFQDNRANGEGTFYSVIGTIYTGAWVNDKRHGAGNENCADGSGYKGDFWEDRRIGKGFIIFSDGSSYEGDVIDDQLHGKGKFVWNDGKEYFGDFCFGKMQGKGVFIWPDGRKYEGEYLNDQKHGFGKYINGNVVYEGHWSFGKKHGEGFLLSENGVSRKGEWDQGKRVKWI